MSHKHPILMKEMYLLCLLLDPFGGESLIINPSEIPFPRQTKPLHTAYARAFHIQL